MFIFLSSFKLTIPRPSTDGEITCVHIATNTSRENNCRNVYVATNSNKFTTVGEQNSTTAATKFLNNVSYHFDEIDAAPPSLHVQDMCNFQLCSTKDGHKKNNKSAQTPLGYFENNSTLYYQLRQIP